MPTALSASDYIYEGVWINWTKGSVLGWTLTVDSYRASILSPALAIFVSIAGSQLWGLFQFALHQVRATSSTRGLLYHQQQIILRNTATDLNTIWRLARTAIAWRHQRDINVISTSLPLLLWALLHFIVIVLAGIFSSWALSTGDQVLSRSPWCGNPRTDYTSALTNLSNPNVAKLDMEYYNYLYSRFAAVQQQVDLCQDDQQDCGRLPLQNMTWTSRLMAGGCPFQQSVCHPDIDGSMTFDTGYLSSSTALGLNIKREDRISFRMTAECAPLNDDKYSTGWQDVPASGEVLAKRVADILYGPSQTNSRNATFTLTQQNLECDQRAVTPPYSLSAQMTYPDGTYGSGTATFQPLPEFQLTEADLSLITLSFLNAYTSPVSDPWFAAQQPYNETDAYCQEADILYGRNKPLTTIGCTQQYQICNNDDPSKDGSSAKQCTPLLSWDQTWNMVLESTSSGVAFSPGQLASAQRTLSAAQLSTFYWAVTSLSQSTTPPLKARMEMSNTVALPLPSDQWQTETKYWMQIILAYMQQTSIDLSTGQYAADVAYINVTKPSGTDEFENAMYGLCRNQIIRSTQYRNFNFFAMVFIILLCSLIIITGLTIEDVIGYIRQRRLNYTGPDGKQDMWIANSVLEMLKTIDETKNGSVWTRTKNGVPVTHRGYSVSIHDLTNQSVDVEAGGTINVAVKRRQTALGMKQIRRHAFHRHHDEAHEHCATSRSFDTYPMSTSHRCPENTATATIMGEAGLTYENDFLINMKPSGSHKQRRKIHIGNMKNATLPRTPAKPTEYTNPYISEFTSESQAGSTSSREDSLERVVHRDSSLLLGPGSYGHGKASVYQSPASGVRGRGTDVHQMNNGWNVLPTDLTLMQNLTGQRRPSSGFVQ